MDILKNIYREPTEIEGVGLEARLTEEAKSGEPARPTWLLTPSQEDLQGVENPIRLGNDTYRKS
jgi:hypothetical protein